MRNILTLIFILILTSCLEQNYKIENQLLECLLSSANTFSVDLKKEFNEFDITSISDDNVVHYVMLVGHGSLYLEDYSDINFTFPNNGNWISAADNMSWRMIAHLSNINIQENQRTYFVLTGSTYLGPKGPINTNDLITSDGIIDYHRYYCEKSIHGNYFWLSTTEYDYHESMYFNDVAAFCNTVPNSTNISYSMVACDKTGDWFPNQNPPIYPTKAWHDPQVLYGVKHITTSNLSTL